MLYPILRPLLFNLDPERSHTIALKSLAALNTCHLLPTKKFSKPCEFMGIHFSNPVGLAAGLDKNGDYIVALAKLGFGFIEVGTVTPRPQNGNPKPRLFRLPAAQALINRMGFNNKGVDYLVEKIQQQSFSGVLGINIGKNADTPIENAISDYLFCFKRVAPYAHYVVMNISSPNTAHLRDLQQEHYLKNLLTALKNAQREFLQQTNKYVPVVVKIAPDLNATEIINISQTLLEYQIDGVIATNATTAREIPEMPHAAEAGGLSGAPLLSKANWVLQQLAQQLQNKIPIIAVGGIMQPADALAKFAAGAHLVQLYTGLIYRGPKLIQEIITAV